MSADAGDVDKGSSSHAGKIALIICALIVLWLFNRFSGESPAVQESRNAELLMWQGHYRQAIDAYTVMIKREPTWYRHYSGRGETYRLMGDLDHALADLNEAIRLKPSEERPFFRRCQVYQAKGEIDRALADCEESARIDPKQSRAMSLLAGMLFARGEFDRAADIFSKLIERAPGNPDYSFYRGQILLFRQNRPAEAADDFARAAKEAFDYRRIGDSLAAQAGSNAKDLMAFEHPFIPDGLYLVIWAHIARVRAGQDDKEQRAEHFVKLGEREVTFSMFMTYDKVTKEMEQFLLAPWPGAIFGLFLGKTTPEAVRAAAESPADPEVRRRRICDADFYIAEYLLEKGTTDEARKLLAAAADGCPPTAREAGFAAAELKRVGP